MDWTAFAIGAIPSIVAVLTLVIQILRDRKKDEAIIGKTRAEELLTDAQAADTITDAAERLIQRYERIIEVQEKRHLQEQQRLTKIIIELGGIDRLPIKD